jgi:hypothetical protein
MEASRPAAASAASEKLTVSKPAVSDAVAEAPRLLVHEVALAAALHSVLQS